ncbi:MAG: ABC transporter permease, partial [Clostridioides sp.]|nr:ABC transporter permease [Clostridioides sp.]
MRSYLSLINIFASKQKRQNSLTIICIVIAVALVTTIFGIADMGIKSKKYSIINTKGNYHIFFSTINKKQINMIKARPEIKVTGDLDIYRASSDDDTSSTNGKGTNTVKYKISGEETNILGVSSDIIKQKMLPIKLIKGRFADNDNEVMLSEQTRVELGASIGDKLEINTANNMTKKVCVVGFVKSDLDLKSEKENLIILNSNFFEKVIEEADYSSSELVLFSKYANIKDVVKDIVKQMNLKENQVKQNTSLLDIIGQSDENYVEKIYLQLIVLATLVSIAGIFMISSTLNTKITQRIKFFGMLNSLGATKKQIKRFVHLEALNWCKVGITVGVLVGVVTVWILYAILHYFVPSYFNDIVGFGISPISIVIGAVIGIVTVYFSSLAPARRAAKISAMEALRGSTIYKKTSLNKRNLKNTGFTSIENVLGMHHAKSSKKNFMLVVCSFSISIVLFITLSSITNSISKLNQTYKPWNQDILINTSFDKNMREKLVNFLKSNDKIKTFSQNFERDIEADRNGKKEKIELSVFDENYF